MPSSLRSSVCKGPEVGLSRERRGSEGLVGSRARFSFSGCQVGSVCRVWWVLLRKSPMAGVSPEAGAAMCLGAGVLQ